jgi:hypothetical protein
MASAAPFMIGTSVRPGTVPLVLLACVSLAAVMQGVFLPLDGDVSWLITVAERVLAGERLYADVFEVNPPASVWLYLPLVWLAQVTGARPEAVVAAAAMLAGLASCAVTLRLMGCTAAMAAVLGVVTLVLPGGLFAQREHFAALLALPVLAALAWDEALSRRAAVAIGVAAGLILAIKPHFALALVPAGLWTAWRLRSAHALLPAVLAGAAVVTTYAAAVLAFAPAYLNYLPLLTAVYLPMREAWGALLIGPVVFVPVAVLVLAWLLRPARVPALSVTLLIGMLGFAAAGVVQGKGYANHALPGSVLGFAALAVLVARGEAARERRLRIGAAATLLALTQGYANARILPPPGLAEAVRRVAPPQPSMITLGTQLVTGHPVVRNLDGRWVGSRAALFTAAGAQARMAEASDRAQLQRWYTEDVRSFADDVARARPSVVLVEVAAKRWAAREPVLAAALRRYRPAARAGAIEVWVRR